MILYFAQYAEFDGYQKLVTAHEGYFWAHNVSHVEEIIKSISSGFTVTDIEFIEFKEKIQND